MKFTRFELKIVSHFIIGLFHARLIEYSPEIEEIDIHNNTIGNMSATLIINALQMRHLSKLLINSNTFENRISII